MRIITSLSDEEYIRKSHKPGRPISELGNLDVDKGGEPLKSREDDTITAARIELGLSQFPKIFLNFKLYSVHSPWADGCGICGGRALSN
jgi:hypothetical protein